MTIKKICMNAMGIAMFVALTLCLQVPVFENYYLCLGYIVMAFYLYHFGMGSGVLTGTLGVMIYCFITGGLRGMPGWVLGNVVIGIICGRLLHYIKRQSEGKKRRIMIVGAVIFSTAIGILGVKSLVEVYLYSLPFAVRIANNIYAFIADVIVLLVGFELCSTREIIWRKVLEE